MEKLIQESLEFREHFLVPFRSNLSPLDEATSIHILTGCLCTDREQRIDLYALVAAGWRLLLPGILQEQKEFDHAQAKKKTLTCGEDTNSDSDSDEPEKS